MTETTGTTAVDQTAVPPLTSYHHISLTVCDVDRSEAWYRDVLGFQRGFVETHPDGAGHAVVMIRPEASLFLGLHHHDANGSEDFAEHRTGMDHLGIRVESREDLDRWAEHLDRHGVRRSEPVDGTIGDVSYSVLNFRDPDNIALELIWLS
jgi:catechol 2,3-dioxygenase-like lactoylglutathione lyase family enzyme